VNSSVYIPDRGDFVWIDFDPQVGHEQAGRRPALVLSPLDYNRPSKLALLCPVTSKLKHHPYDVPIPPGGRVHGVVIADQVKNLAWTNRRAEFIERAGRDLVRDVLERLVSLIDPETV
jgi:mRNA interferase MazF